MGTTLIDPKKKGADLHKLTVPQRTFVAEMLASDLFNPTKAARAAGYKTPSQAANKLMKNKSVQRALGKALRERLERCELKADDVLNYLRAALFFNPLHWFKPTEDGGWEITDLDALPEEVGRLIDEMEVKVRELPDGTKQSWFKVKLISKSTVLPLAMKHLGLFAPELVQQVIAFDWDSLTQDDKDAYDAIEAEIQGGEKNE